MPKFDSVSSSSKRASSDRDNGYDTENESFGIKVSYGEVQQTAIKTASTASILGQPILMEVFSQTDLYPCCEYRARYLETTCFAMEEPKHWATYIRSSAQGGNVARWRGDQKFRFYSSRLLYEKNKQVAHQASTFNQSYSKMLKEIELIGLVPSIPEKDSIFSPILKYDHIIQYKNTMCTIVVAHFLQKWSIKRSSTQPWVFHHNQYPCVMVRIPEIQSSKDVDSLNKIFIAYYIAIVNELAKTKNVPIELVHRASFGHHAPTITSTNESFRINVGIIPIIYADILAEGLLRLHEVVDVLQTKKINPAIAKKKNQQIDSYVEKLIDEHYVLNQELDKLKTQSILIKKRNRLENKINVLFQDKYKWKETYSYLDVLNLKGDTHPKKYNTIAFQLTRMRYYVDYLADYIAQQIQEDSTEKYTKPLDRLFDALMIGNDKNQVAIDSKQLGEVKKRKIWLNPENSEIQKDQAFWGMVESLLIFTKRGFPKRLLGLYGYLETSNLALRKKVACNTPGDLVAEVDCGSDSDCEVSVVNNIKARYAKKIIVNSGMEAINNAYYLARYYLKTKLNLDDYVLNKEYSYFEVESAFSLMRDTEQLAKKSKKSNNTILFFDLNYCDTTKSKEVTLQETLLKTRGKVPNGNFIVLLDYTSATLVQVNKSVKEAFEANASLVLLVNSGLKNEQNADDKNSYGTVRIIALDQSYVRELYEHLLTVLKQRFSPVSPGDRMVVKTADEAINCAYTIARYCIKSLWGEGVYKIENVSETISKLLNDFKVTGKLLANKTEESENSITFFDTRGMSLTNIVNDCREILEDQRNRLRILSCMIVIANSQSLELVKEKIDGYEYPVLDIIDTILYVSVESHGEIEIISSEYADTENVLNNIELITLGFGLQGLPTFSHALRREYKARKFIMTNRLIIGESPETIKNIYDKLIYWNEREVFSDLEMEISLGKKSMKTSKGEPNKALVDSIVDAIVRKRKRNKDSLTLQTVKSVLTSHGFNIPFTEEIQKVSNFLVRYLCKSIEVSFSYRSE